MVLNTAHKVLLVIFLCLVVFNLVLFYKYQQLTSYKVSLPKSEKQQPRYSQFVVNEIRQVKGLVVKKNDQERILVLRQGKEEELRTKLLPQARISKVSWTEKGDSFVVEGDFWQEITRGTEVTGVCADQSCSSLTSLFINKSIGK